MDSIDGWQSPLVRALEHDENVGNGLSTQAPDFSLKYWLVAHPLSIVVMSKFGWAQGTNGEQPDNT
jgi:hypothetical protein